MTSQHETTSSKTKTPFWAKFQKPTIPQPTLQKSPIPELNFLGTAKLTTAICEASTALTNQDLVCIAYAIMKDANEHLADLDKKIAGIAQQKKSNSDCILNYVFD